METQAVGQSAGVVTTGSSATGMDSLKSEDFFQLLVTELQQQDPFEPSDTSDIVAQVSQVRDIELSAQLADTLEQLASQQRTAGTSDLLGKYVVATITDASGNAYTTGGVVTGVRFASDGTAVLELDTGQDVPATLVSWVTTVEALEAAQADSDDSDNDKADATARTNRNPVQTGANPWLTLDGSIRL